MQNYKFIIVTGMSGAGKTRVIQELEDMGYFCVDNIPPILILKFAELLGQGGERLKNIALVVDIRGGEFFNDLNAVLEELNEKNVAYEIVFLDASDEILIKRYKETRRRHPLAPTDRIVQGIAKEKKTLAKIKIQADYLIDTSKMNDKQLKNFLHEKFVLEQVNKSLSVAIVSFGFKYGLPMDIDLLFDVRFLPNPYYLEELKHKSGKEPEVIEYIGSFEVVKEFKTKLYDLVDFLIPLYEREGKKQLVVGIGCTGGMHRSVFIGEGLYEHLLENKILATVEHRDINKDSMKKNNF